jgi:hypothetical protein
MVEGEREAMWSAPVRGRREVCVQREGLGRVARESGGSWFSFAKVGGGDLGGEGKG